MLEQIAKAPHEFDVQARNPANSVHIGGDHMVFSGVYGPPFVLEGGVRRNAMMDDFQRFTKLAQAFPELDSAGGIICEPDDTPLDSRHLDMIFALQTLTDKIYMGNVVSGTNAADSIRMSEILFGGREAIEQHARDDLARQLQLAAALGRPHARGALRVREREPGDAADAVPPDGRDVARLGARRRSRSRSPRRSPGIALVQLIRPGCPVIFGSFLSNIDMQSGSPQFGTPESAVGLLCTGQIARRFGLPFRSGGGLTSSQTPDAQSAYEALMVMLPTFLAGTNWVMHSAGWLEGGLVSSYEKFIIDIEILRMLQVEFTPIEFDDAALAFDAHQEVGHGGHFLGCQHTMERFRTCFYRPLLSSSDNYDRWRKNGGKDAAARSTDIYKKTARRVRAAAARRRDPRGARGVRDPPPPRARRLDGASSLPASGAGRAGTPSGIPRGSASEVSAYALRRRRGARDRRPAARRRGRSRAARARGEGRRATCAS